MLIKAADDKQRRMRLLEDLQSSPLLDQRQREWLQDERMRCQRGQQGEREAAHHIDHWKKDSEHHAVLHDLRFVVDGETAQIDHLVIGRTLHFYLFETKCFGGDVEINEQGEWSVAYANGRRYGVPSPLEQSRRHERILDKLLERLDITGRGSLKPTYHHVVLLHPKATIRRPDAKRFDTRDVIKADMIQRWHEQYIESLGVGDVFGKLLNIHSTETLRGWAEKLARQHRPVNPLELPEFMKPKAVIAPDPAPKVSVPEPSAQADSSHPLYRKLVCATCEAKISFSEGRFCWNQGERFGGLQYCRGCQGG
ncbi:nuclease-related domain-containing protein [Pelomonas sp. BJYL3]|uniref:nuclease-related domain-containing protein n=1 Tax=Pelomonas sp. BJYL3 TaxID=2976697 RepID=UPI0022B55F01|nr:nuclease-related domain-containing protein [Pelomonas sp. BJYL3]